MFRPCVALDGRGVALERTIRRGRRAVVLVLYVERERLVVKPQRDGSRTDIVLRGTETYRQRVIGGTSGYTADKIDERRIEEIVLHAVSEVKFSYGRVSTTRYHRVTGQFGFHIVLADRHTHAIVTIGIGGHKSAFTTL